MFNSQGYAGIGATARANSASRAYAAIHAGSRIEGATPHGLVKILFDELIFAFDAAILAQRQDDAAKASDKQARAASILHALESSLDFDRGGEIAVSLAQIYRASRKLLLEGVRERTIEPIEQARAMVAEIADAWEQIG
ncbi:flagellar export chaperone FliS [Sphingobium sp. SCG-1]|uniref:flagellar export chaperone FliS n=1 Tax=Sphingobium sp. SCG-1 TaxID=2072936 RepID=UPI000CD6761E|nr:flagellar protein FliS [Sphingobium sp. SCG-1]AUW57981.1 flagellar export chaperone FliS [Sphingobium sp. SCG-1]